MENSEENIKTCFVMMPISDSSEYEKGHFSRVYRYLIKPACEKAGFFPIRADDVASSNHIVIDILKKIIKSDIVLCDLSGRNPNVLYELGLRQAFNKPAALIKDDKTSDIFDIQGFRYFPYDHKLRIDNVKLEIDKIAKSLTDTYDKREHDINSIVQLLGVEPAKLEGTVQLSTENSILLEAINGITKRIGNIERLNRNTSKKVRQIQRRIPDEMASISEYYKASALDQAIGKEFYANGNTIGTLIDYSIEDKVTHFSLGGNGDEVTSIDIDSELFRTINQIPF